MKVLPLFRKHRELFVFVAFALFLFVILAFFSYGENPVDRHNKTVTVEIPKGYRFREIVDVIDQAGLITNKPFFYLLAVSKGAARHIRAGEYEMATSMSPVEIIEKLVKGEIKVYPITVQEDITVRQVADRLLAYKLINEKAFMDLVTDRNFLSSLGIAGSTAEGYLYPNTYYLDRTMTEREIIRTMVRQFWKIATPQMRQRAAELGFTTQEFVTLASMIGKETGNADEKPLVSAVFHNRLKRGMKLQSDPTAIYRLAHAPGSVTKNDLKKHTLHNTYRIHGLPPSPIANPGADSLLAALYPAPVNYLYFVSKNNGTHYFSTNFFTHNEAVVKYQIERQKN